MEYAVLSPEKAFAQGSAVKVEVPGELGELGFLKGHAPIVSQLGVGEVRVFEHEHEAPLRYFVSGGYVEVIDDVVTILGSVIELPKDIDLERAKAAAERAARRLGKVEGDVDLPRALAALKRARARQKLAGQTSAHGTDKGHT